MTNDGLGPRKHYYRLLDDMARLIGTARDDSSGFSRSTIALMNLERQVQPAIDALAAWEMEIRTTPTLAPDRPEPDLKLGGIG